MNSKTFSVLLGLAALVLGIGWLLSSREAEQRAAESAARIARMSNELVETTARLTQQQSDGLRIQTNLVLRSQELGSYSNRWATTAQALLKSEADARAAVAAAQAEIQKRDQQIQDLEDERDGLTAQLNRLKGDLETLNGQIAETQRKLAASEGDRDQLQRELRLLLAEKADLERRFNDVASLRDQVRKLREEINVSRRVDLIRRGVYGVDKKGAQVLNEGIRRPAPKIPGTNLPVQAELGTDGSVKVSAPTNPAPQ